MRNMLDLKRLVVVAVAALVSGSAAAAADQHPAVSPVSFYGDANVPDISGVWLGTAMGIPGQGVVSNSGQTADGRPPVYWAPWPLPYTPKYQEIYDKRVAAAKKGVQLGDTSSRCLPFGLPNMLASQHYPEEIIQTPGQVTFYFFGTFPVTIWTDGRPHPKDLAPSWNGHSIGHWVGDILFVDTVGILGDTALDSHRDPHSGKLHITWRVEKVAKDILHIQLTLFDDDAFTEPVTLTNITIRKDDPKWAVLDDQSCFENNQSVGPPVNAAGFIKF